MDRVAAENLVPSGRRNNFDGIRLLAAVAVIVSHQSLMVGRAQPHVGMLDLGTLAVLVFFSISGYLVASSWAADPNALRFAARRLLRIWPAYAVVVIISAAAVFFIDYDPPFTGMAGVFYLRNLVFYHFEWTYFQSNPFHQLNGSLWTIPIEVACYALVATLGVMRLPMLAVAGAAALWFFVADGQTVYLATLGTSTLTQPLFFTAFFVIGAAVHAAGPRSLIALMGAACLLIAFGQWAPGLILGVPGAVLSVSLRSWPGLRDAARWGDFSYGTYLWAFPVQQLGVLWLGRDAPFPVLLALTLAATGLLAALSWHLIEAPALRLKPSNKRRRAMQRVVADDAALRAESEPAHAVIAELQINGSGRASRVEDVL